MLWSDAIRYSCAGLDPRYTRNVVATGGKLSPVRVTVFVLGPAGIAAGTINERLPSAPEASTALTA